MSSTCILLGYCLLLTFYELFWSSLKGKDEDNDMEFIDVSVIHRKWCFYAEALDNLYYTDPV